MAIRSLKLAEFTIQPDLNEITKLGQSVRLEPKSMQVLLYMMRHPGEILSKERLLGEIWQGSYVGDEVLTHAVWEIRRALEDNARNPRFLRTVPKQGYCLLITPTTEEKPQILAGKQVPSIVRWTGNLMRDLFRSRIERRLAVIGLCLLGVASGVSYMFPQLLVAIPLLSKLLFGLGTLLLTYAIFRIGIGARNPPDQKFQLGSNAIKGAAPFTPEDAQLFSRLGRQQELSQLCSWILDDQVPLIVLMGESGVGKTSLLRAGLTYAMNTGVSNQAHPIAYWEARPGQAKERLEQAFCAQLGPEPFAKGPVLLVDQAEQLDPDQERPLFEKLRRSIEADPPLSATWVVAFRREFLPSWMDFQLQLEDHCFSRIKTLSLRRFDPKSTQKIISSLLDAAEISIAGPVVEEVVSFITEEDSISPVDLGISLQILTRQPNLSRSLREFRTMGGHTALITSYLDHCLETCSAELRSETLRALLCLIDIEDGQRLPDGKSNREIIAKVRPIRPRHLELSLKSLSAPGVRILEITEHEPLKYRLIHERFAPAIRKLTGKLLHKAERASLLLTKRYRVWTLEDQHRKHLLAGRELRRILQQEPHLRWGENQASKQLYLRNSRNRRNSLRALTALASSIFFILLATTEHKRKITTLHDDMYQSGILKFVQSLLPRVTALEIGFAIADHESIFYRDWFRQARNLKRLSLRVGRAQKNLEFLPEGLSKLFLSLQESQVTSLAGLPAGTQELSLDLGGSHIDSLKGIPNDIQRLAIDLGESKVYSLDGIPDGIQKLELDLRESRIRVTGDNLSSRKPRAMCNISGTVALRSAPERLDHLSLKIGPPAVSSISGLPNDLRRLDLDLSLSDFAVLETITSSVKELNLSIRGAMTAIQSGFLPQSIRRLALSFEASTVRPLVIPDRVDSLTMFYKGPGSPQLDEIPRGVRTLDLSFLDQDVINLDGIPQRVRELRLLLHGNQGTGPTGIPKGVRVLGITYGPEADAATLPLIPEGLEELTLAFMSAHRRKIRGIPKSVKRLHFHSISSSSLDLDWLPADLDLLVFSPPRDLKSLTVLPRRLGALDMNLVGSELTSLSGLPDTLRSLRLALRSSALSDVSDLPKGLRTLTLDLRSSNVKLLRLEKILLTCLALAVDRWSSLRIEENGLPTSLRRLHLVIGAREPHTRRPFNPCEEPE